MSEHKLSKPSDYSDYRHKKFAGTPAEIAGKVLQKNAHYPKVGWASYSEDFLVALEAYKNA